MKDFEESFVPLQEKFNVEYTKVAHACQILEEETKELKTLLGRLNETSDFEFKRIKLDNEQLKDKMADIINRATETNDTVRMK